MAGKILILRWPGSAYDALGGLSEEIAQEFVGLGQDVALFAVGADNWQQRLVQVLQQGDIAFVLTMSGVGVVAFDANQTLLWDAVKVPIMNWSCDHPCAHPVRHGIRSRFVLHGYVFPDHGRYHIDHLNPNGIAFAIHLGLPARRVFADAPLPLRRRNRRIIFSKSGGDTNQIEARWRLHPDMLRRILFDAAEALFHCGTSEFLPVLKRVAEPHGLLLTGNNMLTLRLIQELDGYIRFRRANLVMQALLDYPVDVFGTGWDHLRWSGAKAVLQGAVPWREAAVRLLPQYLGCLSINPLVEHSVHDRVFFALSAGVAPVSDANAFSTARMPGLRPYSFDFTPEHVRRAADALLDEPAEAIARTETAWQALSDSITMRHAAQNILQFVALHDSNLPVLARA